MSTQTKIALATEDGKGVSAHFGRAPYFEVLTIEDGKVAARERRVKAFHPEGHAHGHVDSTGRDVHAGGMVAVVQDCAAVIAGGMGTPAYTAIQAAGLVPIVTDEKDIETAALSYANGTLVNRIERLH